MASEAEIQAEREEVEVREVLTEAIAQHLVRSLPMTLHWGSGRPGDGILTDIQRRIIEITGWVEPEPVGARGKKVSMRTTLDVLTRDGYQCVCCGEKDGLHIDHIVPISRGGTNAFTNLQTLCGPCNSSKGTDYACRLVHA